MTMFLFFWLIVVCEWVGGGLLVMAVVLDVLGVVVVWVCEWCISSRVCIVIVLSVYISDEPSVCCVCGYI